MDYDPNLLDDPQWPCGKHKRVLIFPSYMVSSVEAAGRPSLGCTAWNAPPSDPGDPPGALLMGRPERGQSRVLLVTNLHTSH